MTASRLTLGLHGLGRNLLTPRLIGCSHSGLLSLRGIKAPQAVERLTHPDPSVYETEHFSKHWKIERIVAVGLLPLMPCGVIFAGSATLDYILSSGLILHAYWGLKGVAQDYLSWRGVTLYKTVKIIINILCSVGFCGICYFNFTDIGITGALKSLWTL